LGGSVYELGAVLKGTFDFSSAMVACHQVSVRLETEEMIEPSLCNPMRGKKPVSKTIAEHHQITFNALSTSFSFHIPVVAPQQMQTELVSLKWVLQFEFLTAKKKETNTEKKILEIEPLQWTLPIQILVPNIPPESIYKARNSVLL